MDRATFLQSVRTALGKSPLSPVPNYAPLRPDAEQQWQKVAAIEARVAGKRDELLARLADVAARQGWQVCRAASGADALAYVVKLAREKVARSVARSAHGVFQRLALDAALAEAGAQVMVAATGQTVGREQLRQVMANADIGVTGVDYAIAETGSVVLVPRQGVSRLVSLLPPVHMAIVAPQQVYESLDDVFALRRLAFLQGNGDMGSYLSFISGPSRTADIEQTIVVGVHGPVEVHLVLLETYPPLPSSLVGKEGYWGTAHCCTARSAASVSSDGARAIASARGMSGGAAASAMLTPC